TFFRRFAQPAHGQCQTTNRTDFNRYLVVSTTYTAAFYFNNWLNVVNGGCEHFNRIFAGFFLDVIKGAINNTFGNSFLAGQHHHVHEFGKVNVTKLRIGQNFYFGYFATPGHVSFLCDNSVVPCSTATTAYFRKQPLTCLCLMAKAARTQTKLLACGNYSDYLGRFAPYLGRACLRSLTPCKSSAPRTMW